MCYDNERKDEMWCCAISVAFFCPPLAVLLLHGCGMDFLLNCILTFLCYVPGFIHALCIVFAPDYKACRAREKAEYLARAQAREEALARQAVQSPSFPPPPPPTGI